MITVETKNYKAEQLPEHVVGEANHFNLIDLNTDHKIGMVDGNRKSFTFNGEGEPMHFTVFEELRNLVNKIEKQLLK